ncbi:AAA family ATPase [Coprococcus sp. RTP21281st1_F1_RTP21281_210402]|uniref:ParA family protein n=1 Tax=Coprococcus sp. RTP21281st1_F1_RTP21281_210402 TaxID=3143208 RepID=UPI0034A3E3A4
MARIISIVNQKGGTGKSACTANLAVGLAQKNMKVLIVDADPQSDVSAGFGYRDCDDSNETLTVVEVTFNLTNEKPEVPETPNTPDTPQSHEETKVSNAPKTGDSTNIWLPILLLIISTGGMAGLYISRKRKNK